MSAAIQIPDDLAELDHCWSVWRMVSGAKIPYRTDGRRASTTEPRDWGELSRALRAFDSGRYTGLAFAFFHTDRLVGIDLDHCLDSSGNPKPWARGVVERFADTYGETSPSGNGLKFWGRGSLPANRPKVVVGGSGEGIELYDHARFFTFTGRNFRNGPLEVADHAADLLLLYEHLNKRSNERRRNWPLQPVKGGRIPYGQQHSTLVSLAGTLRARRICDEAIEACLQAVNTHQCERPGAAENISRIVCSRRWGAA